jgi:hypothetical protein
MLRLLNPESPEFEYARSPMFAHHNGRLFQFDTCLQDPWYAAGCAGEWLHVEKVLFLAACCPMLPYIALQSRRDTRFLLKV